MTGPAVLFPSPHPDIYCLLDSTHAHPRLSEVLPPARLLSDSEHARFEAFWVPKRRRDWLLGRWTAKHLVQSYLRQTQGSQIALDGIEIIADDDGAPYVRLSERLRLSLSISHSGIESFCALCANEAGEVGADIEQIEPRAPELVRTFFTPAENAAVLAALPSQRDTLITTLWSTKEAVLKALRLGLRADTRQVDILVSNLAPEWNQVAITLHPALLPSAIATLNAWCLVQPTHVLTLALLKIY